jgi:hypothetical protein
MAVRNAAHFYAGSGFDELNESISSTSTSITSTSMSIAPVSSSPVPFQSILPKNGPNGPNLSNNPELDDIFGSDVYFPPGPNTNHTTVYNNELNNSNVYCDPFSRAGQSQSNQSPLVNRRNPPIVQNGTPTRAALSNSLNTMNLSTPVSATKRQRVSAVWDYFSEGTLGTAMTSCKECGAEIQRVKGSTSSMIKHLKMHGIVVKAPEEETAIEGFFI